SSAGPSARRPDRRDGPVHFLAVVAGLSLLASGARGFHAGPAAAPAAPSRSGAFRREPGRGDDAVRTRLCRLLPTVPATGQAGPPPAILLRVPAERWLRAPVHFAYLLRAAAAGPRARPRLSGSGVGVPHPRGVGKDRMTRNDAPHRFNLIHFIERIWCHGSIV